MPTNYESINLEHMVQKSPDPLVAGTVQVIRKESEVMDRLKFMTKAQLTVKNYLEGEIKDIGFRRINQPFGSVVHGKMREVNEGIYAFGNAIDIDVAYLKDKSEKIIDPMVAQTKATVKSMARGFTDMFINNYPTDNPEAITGLRYRLSNPDICDPEQTVQAGTGGNPLDLSPYGASYNTNVKIFFRMLEKAISECAEKPDFAICNKQFINALSALHRDSGYLKTTEDSLGRKFIDYDGIIFTDAKIRNDKTQIIGNAETATGEITGGACTSVYFVKQGPEFLQPFQMEPLEVKPIGLLDDGVTERTVISWYLGYLITHPKSVSRLCGLKLQ